MKKFGNLVVVLIVFALLASACIPYIGDPLARYNKLIQSYQSAQKAAATSQACFSLVGQQLNMQISVYNNYLSADVAKTAVYRANLQAAQSKVDTANYAASQALSSGQPDLGELAAAGGTPADLATGFTLMVNAFTEAPLAPVDPSALANTQRIISEQFNKAQSCVTDWNDAVAIYNTERNQISGDVVGTIAQKLGVKDLPASLPYFIPPANSANPFNMTAPTVVFPTP